MKSNRLILSRNAHILTVVGAILLAVAMSGVVSMFYTSVAATVKDGGSTSSGGPTPCTNFYACALIDQITKSADYLMRNKKGLTYTPDPRNIQPFSEMVRLNLDTQAGGFLNLYRLTGSVTYRSEAEQRLNYILSLGPSAFNNSPFDGMTGYIFLQGGELLNNLRFRYYGLKITDACLAMPVLTLDPGYMCDMALAKAYALTSDKKYLDKLRASTAETASRQFGNGGFPHSNEGAGPSANYTAWMIEESYLMRPSDPNNPDLDATILRSRDFLKGRVNADGSVTAYPGEPDGVGMSTLSSIAYSLQGLGEDALAQRVLQFLFSKQFTGGNSGSYADAWANDNPNDYWTQTSPSVLRTSLIFWDLSNIAADRKVGQCVPGPTAPCTITPTNCSAAFAALNSCNLNYAGTNTCLNGQSTKCINTNLIVFDRAALCGSITTTCSPNDPYCWSDCGNPGTKKCIGDHCGSCVDWDNRQTSCLNDCSQTPPLQCLAT